MKYMKITGILLILAFALSACGGAGTPTSVPVNTLPAMTDTVEPLSSATPEVTGTETPAVSTTGTAAVPVTGADCTTVTVQAASAASTSGGGTSATSMPSTTGTGTPSTTTGTSTPSTGGGTSTVASGDFLVDCNGMTLYINMDDTANSGTSVCTADCATEWPALTVKDGETPMAGEGVDDSLLSTLTRDDGTLQVTYNGWPLYLFSGDSLPGDKNGVGVESKWLLISPTGEPIQQ